MIAALSKILGYFDILWSFIGNFFASLVTFLDVAVGAMSLPFGMVAWMPYIIGASVTCVVSIAIVKLVLGR